MALVMAIVHDDDLQLINLVRPSQNAGFMPNHKQ